MITSFQTGTYRHWQGDLFSAVALLEHPETGELLVVCERRYDGKKLLRPYATPGQSSWTDPLPDGRRRFEFVSGIAMASAVHRSCGDPCLLGDAAGCSRGHACVLGLLREYGP